MTWGGGLLKYHGVKLTSQVAQNRADRLNMPQYVYVLPRQPGDSLLNAWFRVSSGPTPGPGEFVSLYWPGDKEPGPTWEEVPPAALLGVDTGTVSETKLQSIAMPGPQFGDVLQKLEEQMVKSLLADVWDNSSVH